MRVSAEVCSAYFGLEVDDPQAFADWLMAISALLFADLSGDSTTRTLALVGAKHVISTINQAIRRAKAGRVPHDTLVYRLVNQQQKGEGPSDGEIRALLTGLAVGFVPTNTLAAGHILEVLFSNPKAMDQARQAVVAGDDKGLNAVSWRQCALSHQLYPVFLAM